MKLKNIFGKNGALLLGAAMTFAFTSCNTDVKSNQSIQREVEEEYDDSDINEPEVTYENGEYVDEEENVERVSAGEEPVTTGLGEPGYNYDDPYGYEEREVVVNKVEEELNRANRTINELERKIEEEGDVVNAELKQEWEKAKVELEEKRTELNDQLEELETATEDEWEQVRIKTNQTLEELGAEWDELSQDLEIDTEEGVDN
ncbi:sll1863 family stress response protein [Nafulsella turpanensis]|uniref:hypothetical protein n=1 Tax=Nafulsella turpanensis TaxID=1265690 RepID=UPI000345D0CE|nr:hypothetical protein [Nafulsella turpanensis]